MEKEETYTYKKKEWLKTSLDVGMAVRERRGELRPMSRVLTPLFTMPPNEVQLQPPTSPLGERNGNRIEKERGKSSEDCPPG